MKVLHDQLSELNRAIKNLGVQEASYLTMIEAEDQRIQALAESNVQARNSQEKK